MIADFFAPPRPLGWVVVGRGRAQPGRAGSSRDAAVAALVRAGLGTMVVDLPTDAAAAAGWIQVAANHLRQDLGQDVPIAYLGEGGAATPGWIAAAGGAVDGVMAWNPRSLAAWSYLPHVAVPSIVVVAGEARPFVLLARATSWRLGCRPDVVSGPKAGHPQVLSAWYHERLLYPTPAPARPHREPARLRVASVAVAGALVAAPAGAYLANLAAQPAAAAAAQGSAATAPAATPAASGSAALPDFSAGKRIAAAEIAGDDHGPARPSVQTGAAEAATGTRLSASQIGGDGKAAKGPHADPPLVDGIGVRWHVNTNIGFATSSSASGAVSEAEFTHAVAATTLNGGTVNATLNDAFDGYNGLCVDVNNVGGQCGVGTMASYNQNGPASLECSNRQVVYPSKTIGNFSVARKVFVPTNSGFARWLDIVTNTSASPQTVRLQTSNNLGSDSNTRVVTTSDGDATPETTDQWVTTFQNYSGTTSTDVRLGHVLQGPGAPVGLSAIQFVNGDDNPLWRYDFSIPAGETAIIMNYATGQASTAAAATESAALASLTDAHALDCLTATEKAEIKNFQLATATPTIATQASAGGPLGTSLTDTATLAGGNNPTGTVTFRLFTDPACASQVFATTNALVGGTATSSPFTPSAPGTYYWTADYNGDANNAPVSAACNSPNESAAITKAQPAIATQASPGGPVGTSVTDAATVSGGSGPTGTVTFRLFTDAACGNQVFATSSALSAGAATSSAFQPAAAGTYYWTAVYNGDANNDTATSPCGAANESVLIGPPAFTKTLTGDVTGPVTVNSGESLLVSGARVTGPIVVNPGGALTVTNSQVTNGIVANGPVFFSLCGSQVSSPFDNRAQGVIVQGATTRVLVGDPANGCALNKVAGDVTLSGNTQGLVLGGNVVSRTITVNNNTGPSITVKGNQAFTSLSCSGNNPAPTNDGQANTSPSKTGQCAGL